MTHEDIIRQLLRTFNEARDTLYASGDFHGANPENPPQMSRVWQEGSYADLERALKEMHGAIDVIWCSHNLFSGLPIVWWHLTQRYLMSHKKAIWKVGPVNVETLIRRKKCVCGWEFTGNRAKSREHVEQAHKPKPTLVDIYTKEYSKLLREQRDRCDTLENLGVQYLVQWFKSKGITPQLPKAFT